MLPGDHEGRIDGAFADRLGQRDSRGEHTSGGSALTDTFDDF